MKPSADAARSELDHFTKHSTLMLIGAVKGDDHSDQKIEAEALRNAVDEDEPSMQQRMIPEKYNALTFSFNTEYL